MRVNCRAIAGTLAMVVIFSSPASAKRAPDKVTVTVDTSAQGAQINRNIYGQFSEHLGRGIYEGIWVGEDSNIPNIRGYRKDVVDALRKIRVPVLRWPGGCFADQYDWRDGIGPRDKRPVRINFNWGGVPETNTFGTHEFLNFAELIGADAYISGNMGSLTPHDMAQWLEYMTSAEKSSLTEERRKNGRKEPWHVKFFGIGNEVWGCGGAMRAEYAADTTSRYSAFLSDPPGETFVRVASGPTGNLPGYESFTETFMRDSGGFQALSLHYYSRTSPSTRATGFGEEKWAQLLRSALNIESIISKVAAIMDKYDPDKKVALFVDEWGAWHKEELGTNPGFAYQQSTLLDAEVAALTLNIFHRHTDRVKMANIAQMINVIQAMILTRKEKMLLTPTYHVFDMYSPFQGAVPFDVRISAPEYQYGDEHLPSVDASAGIGKDGKLYLALVNLDPVNSASVSTNLSGIAHGTILTGQAMDTHNTFEAPNIIHPMPFASNNVGGKVAFDLPAKSVAVVVVE